MMPSNPLTDIVAAQYETWVYPEPIQDLPAWLIGNWQWFDPSHAHRQFWPDREYRPNLDILIAGCGTNQAAVFAYTNPEASIVAIDVSGSSLEHHRFLKQKYSLKNLELHKLPIEEVGSLGREYDLVVSTGVLHHMSDPKAGIRALAKVLRVEGVAAIMLYARYGRLGVEMLQGVFRDLGLVQNDSSLTVVKAAIASLPQDHPLRSYMTVAPDLQFDAGLVDTFLHGRDRSYTVADCLDFVAAGGLVFQDWFLKSSYEPTASPGDPFLSAVTKLPREQRWAVMERVNHRNGCHFFTACHPERPPETYQVSVASEQWLDAVPFFRYRCELQGDTISRPGWATRLNQEQLSLLRLVDGRRTINAILSMAPQPHTARPEADRKQFARNLFESLVNRDFLTLGLAGQQ